MYVVFVEYVVFYDRKEEYLAHMTILQRENPTMELLESADQEGLFVEIWKEISDITYSVMMQERTEEAYSSFNADLHGMIDQSKNRIRMWKFNPKYAN